MKPRRSDLQPNPVEPELAGAPRDQSPRAGIVTLAQIVAAGGYGVLLAFGGAPTPFSVYDWLFTLLPPAVFAFLLVAGLFGLSTHLPVWQRAVSGAGSLLAGVGLALSLVLLPLFLVGSLMDYVIG